MSHRPKSSARAARLLRLAALAALAAGSAMMATSCTQDFGSLVDGMSSGGDCVPGKSGGDCPTPGGCPNCSDGRCKLDCDVCGETCAPFACTEPSCSTQCINGASCEVHCPVNGTDTVCSVGANRGVVHVLGAATTHTVNCDQHAICSLAPIKGQRGKTVLNCTSGSSCSARTSGTDFQANCSGQSTCVVECGALEDSPSCNIDCNDSSVCRVKCPGDGKSCDFKCSGHAAVRCGDGWSACDQKQCPP